MESYNNKRTVALLSFCLLFTLPLIIIIISFLALAYMSSFIKRPLNKFISSIKIVWYILMNKIKTLYQSYLQDIIKALSFNFLVIFALLILIEWITVDPRQLKNIVEVCIPFIAAIIGLSIPFGVEMVNKINEKYNSTWLVKGFQSENAYLSFFASILICIGSSVVWILSEHFEGLNNTVLFLPHKLLLVSTLLLFMCLFWFMYLIMLYYQPKDLADRYMCFGRISLKSERYLPMIKDLMIYSLIKYDDEIQRSLTRYLDDFRDEAIKSSNEKKENSVVYPYEYFRLIYEVNHTLSTKGISKTGGAFSIIAKYLVLPFNYSNKISKDTFQFIFLGIQQYINSNRKDLYKSYWQQAHQYVEYNLRGTENNIISRQQQFKDFHFMLGASLIDKEKYDWIKFMFRFTNSQPAHYYLLSSNIGETIELFMRVRRDLIWGNPSEGFRAFIVNENDGIVGDSYFFKYLQQYVALLFLRLYTLQTYYTYGDPFAEVYTPSDLSEKRFWFENLKYLNEFINQVLTDGIPELVGLPKMDAGWFEDNKKEKPSGIIDRLTNDLSKEVVNVIRKAELATNKINELKSSSKEIFSKSRTMIEKVFIPLTNLNPSPDSECNCVVTNTYDRAVFLNEGGINHFNFDSFTARQLVDDLFNRLTAQFSWLFPKGIYTLKVDDILSAIDKILEKKTRSEYEIICFAFSLLNFRETRNTIVDNNGRLSYNGTDINEIRTGGFRNELTGKMCIIKKTDKPKIRFIEPDGIDYFGLTELPDDSKCYYKLVEYDNKPEDLKFSASEVCVILATKAEVEWKDCIEAVFLKPVFGYRQNDEAPQSVDEVTSFK